MWWAYIRGGGLYSGGAYSRRFTVYKTFKSEVPCKLPLALIKSQKVSANDGYGVKDMQIPEKYKQN
jgi:hypothetical protein